MLRSRQFASVVGLMLIGWTLEGMILPLIPFLVLRFGGDAFVVGVVAASYALPSLIFRPTIGRLIDARGHDPLLRLGAFGFALAPLGFLLPPPIGWILVFRMVQGLSWTMYSTATHVALARLAPVDRRGEASGYASFARAMGLFLGPPIGIALYLQLGDVVFVIGAILGAVAFGGTWLLRVPAPAPAAVPASPADAGSSRWFHRLLEPAAVPSMVLVATFVSAQALFVGFAPLYANAVGATPTELGVFYAVFALVLAGAPLITGRISDRIGRQVTILAGCLVVSVSLLVAIVPFGMLTFTIAAAGIASANSMATSAIAATTMDHAPPGRMGASLATYQTGFQLSTGIGGLIWGLTIAVAGFPWPFVIAIGFQAISAGIALRWLPRAPVPSRRT